MTWRHGLLTAWALLFIWALWRVDGTYLERRWTNDRVVRELGLTGYAVWDIATWLWALTDDIDDVDTAPYRAFLDARRAHYPAPRAVPLDKRKNVVFLQLESVDALTLDLRVEGKPAMPFLSGLRSRAIRFDTVLDQTGAGRSSDAHVLVLTSQMPVAHAAVFTKYDLSRVPSLPRVLAEHGYHTLSIEGSYGDFWRWKQNHRRLGIATSYGRGDLDDSEIIGLGISDCSVIDQALEKLAAVPRPFFLYVVLLTNHHPFDDIREREGLPAEGLVSDYVHSVRYTDACVERLFDGMSRMGVLKNTLAAVYSDHDSGISEELHDAMGRSYEPGIKGERIPLLLWDGGQTDKIARPVGLLDLAPTVLHRLGLPIPRTFVGIPVSASEGAALLQQGVALTPDGWVDLDLNLSILTRLAIERPEAL